MIDPDTGEDLSTVETVLKNIGIQLRNDQGQFRNFQDVLDETAVKWKELEAIGDKVGQTKIASALGLTRQQEKAKILFEHYDEAIKYAEVSANSLGTAEEKFNNAYLTSTQYSMEAFTAQYEQMSNAIWNSGLIKGTFDTGTGLLGALTWIIDNLGTIPTLATVAAGAISTISNKGVFTTLGNDGFLNNMALLGKSFKEVGGLFKTSFGDAFADVNSKFDTAVSGAENLKATMSGVGQGIKGVFTTPKDSLLELMSKDDAKSKILEFAKAFDNGAVSLQEFTAKLDNTGMKSYLETVNAGKASFEGYQKYVDTTNAALQKTTLASKAATLGIKALSMAMNMALTLGAMWVVFEGIPKLVDAMIVTVDEHREGLDKLKSAYKSINEEITSINSELETTEKRVSELQDKLTLTFVEQEELSKLQTVTSELERQKGILEAQKKIEQAGVNKKFVDTMEANLNSTKKYKNYTYEDSNNDGKESLWETINSGAIAYTNKQGNIDNNLNELETLNQQLVKTEEEYQAALENGNKKQQNTLSDKVNNYRTQIQEIKEALNTELRTVQSDSNGISYINNPTTDDEKSVNNWLDFIADFEDKIAIAVNGSGAKEIAFDRIINKEKFADLKKEIEDLASSGKLASETLGSSKYSDLVKNLEDVGISVKETTVYFNELHSEIASGQSDLSIPTLEEANKNIDSLQAKYQSLSGAIDDYNSKNYMTIDNLQTIIGLGHEYMQYLSIENGQLVMNKDALIQLALARIDDAEAAYLEEATNLVGTFTNEAVAAKYLESDTSKLADSRIKLANANWNAASSAAAMQTAETGSDTAAKAVETLKKTVANARVIFDATRSSVGKYTSAISEAGSTSQNASKQISDAQKNINDLLATTIQMLRKEYELQKEVIQDKKKALELELSGLQKKIDLQIELLQKKKDEHDYERDLKNKQKDVSDIQNELFKLRNDDSAEARKRKLELEAELTGKLDSLNEFLFDNEIKLQEDALNSEKDRLDEKYQIKQDVLDQEIEAIEDYVSMEVNLRLEAMALIEGRSQEFYNRLQLWNYQYGDGLRATIDLAWQSCYASMDMYNQGQYNVAYTLELLASKMADFENATRNAIGAANELNSSLAQRPQQPQDNAYEQIQKKIQQALAFRKPYRPSDSEYQQLTKIIEDYKKQLISLPKHHSGGVVADSNSTTPLSRLANLNGGEVLIKALKGELVVTEKQQTSLIKSLNSQKALSASYNIFSTIPAITMGDININGDVESQTIEKIKKAQKNQIDYLLLQMKRKSNKEESS